MRPFTAFSLFLLAGVAAFLFSLSTGCANIIPPTGGPRDSTPPRLLSVVPADSTLNFRGDRITFTFDEYLDDPQDLQNNLLFTPTFEVNPELGIRARTLTVRFRDSLLPNTTYILNFGNALRDVNEGNVLRNFMYTFSTGPVLDSLNLTGNVTVAETGKVDSTLVVVLHRNRTDSAVIRERPVYVAKVDANGNFRFRNLPPDSFAIYALGDAGLMRRYQNPTQLFAFADSAVVPGKTAALNLFAYRARPQASPTFATPANRTPSTDRRLRFSTPTGQAQDLQSDFVLTFATPLRQFDSTGLQLFADSSFTPVAARFRLDSTRTALRIRAAWREATLYNLVLNRDFADDSAGRRLLKTDTLDFRTKALADYGQVSIRLRNLDLSRNPVLQFLQGDQVVFSAPVRGGVFQSRFFAPGDYDLRILYDTNGNGQWDPGQFFGARRQPERTRNVNRKITVKPAWDNEFDLSL